MRLHVSNTVTAALAATAASHNPSTGHIETTVLGALSTVPRPSLPHDMLGSHGHPSLPSPTAAAESRTGHHSNPAAISLTPVLPDGDGNMPSPVETHRHGHHNGTQISLHDAEETQHRQEETHRPHPHHSTTHHHFRFFDHSESSHHSAHTPPPTHTHSHTLFARSTPWPGEEDDLDRALHRWTMGHDDAAPSTFSTVTTSTSDSSHTHVALGLCKPTPGDLALHPASAVDHGDLCWMILQESPWRCTNVCEQMQSHDDDDNGNGSAKRALFDAAAVSFPYTITHAVGERAAHPTGHFTVDASESATSAT